MSQVDESSVVILGEDEPSLHVRLSVFLSFRVIEFKSTEAGTSHEKICDEHKVVNVLLISILEVSE